MAKIKKRLDVLLVDLGFFDDIEKARRSILAHEVKIDTTYASSVATWVELDNNGLSKQKIFVKNKKDFVSRGGYKLQKALDVFELDVIGKKCLDIGSSTGGFTDCLLQYGASEVVCVDVCYGQLDWKLRTNNKVKVFEQTNIKNISKKKLQAPFDIIVADLSFISLASLAKIIASFCRNNTVFIGLVKPQFESKHDETVKGIVVSENVRKRTIYEVKMAFEDAGFAYVDYCKSPIKGRAGNIEYLIKLIYIF